MPRQTSLIVVLLAGAAIAGLSVVPGWLVVDRILLGEGPRELLSHPNAWQAQAVPFVPAAVIVEAVAGAIAGLLLVIRATPVTRAVLAIASAAGLGLLVGATWPVSQAGHASSVSISPGWPLGVAIGIGVIALACAVAMARLPRGPAMGIAFVAVVVAVGGAGGRAVGLNLAEGTGQHWSEGTYTRAATSGEGTELLTMRSGRFSFDDRWSGTFEPSGNVVILTGDPACPDARGTYHVHAAGGSDIRWEKIVDLCAGGERARDLQAGIWARNP